MMYRLRMIRHSAVHIVETHTSLMVVNTTGHSWLTVIVPIATYHQDIATRAIASIEGQSLECDYIGVVDEYGIGPGLLRNLAVQQAQTPFVAFLDADDTLHPDYAAWMLEHWQPGHYVYCDWKRGDEIRLLPDHFPGKNYQLHLNSCLISRNIFLEVGGYNETINWEDTDFWFRVMSRGVCGIHCPLPLVNYSDDGRRSDEALRTQSFKGLDAIYERYGSMAGKCCGSDSQPNIPQGEHLDGDILVKASWGGNMARIGTVSRREYPRTGNGKSLWVDPRDAAAEPNLYVALQSLDQIDPVIDSDISLSKIKADIQAKLAAGQ